jgi:hypothetical protein
MNSGICDFGFASCDGSLRRTAVVNAEWVEREEFQIANQKSKMENS